MTTSTQQPTSPEKKQSQEHDALIIDTSKMNQGQAAAMEVAESARDSGDDRGSFAGPLFMGSFDPSWIEPFPHQSDEDRAIGDELVQKVSAFLAEHLNADEADETRTIPSTSTKA